MVPAASNEDKFNKWVFHLAMIVTWALIFLRQKKFIGLGHV